MWCCPFCLVLLLFVKCVYCGQGHLVLTPPRCFVKLVLSWCFLFPFYLFLNTSWGMTWFPFRLYRKYESYLILPLKGVLPWMISPIDAKKLIFCVCLKRVFTIESVRTLSLTGIYWVSALCPRLCEGLVSLLAGLMDDPTPPHRATLLLTTGLFFSVQRSVEILGNIKGSLYPHLTYNFEGKETAYKVRQNGKSNIKEVGRGWWSILSEGERLPLAPTME